MRHLSDAVNHPSHYTDGKIEVIDFIEDKGLGFCLGNAVKYISRAGKKDPAKEVEDLKKAVWYINRRIQELEQESDCDIEDLSKFDDAKIISRISPVKVDLLGEKNSALGDSIKIANKADQCSYIQFDETTPWDDEDDDCYEEKESDDDFDIPKVLGGWTDEDLMPKGPQKTKDDGQINATDEERDELTEMQRMYGILHIYDPSYTWEQFLGDYKQAKAELKAEREKKITTLL